MGTKATLKAISQQLNLSISTVSRALSNHPDISASTKKKVTELAELIEYEPNSFAINLRTNKSKIYGVLVPEISNFFYHSFISAIEEEARLQDHSVMILQSLNNEETELNNIKFCRQNRVAGIFICSLNYEYCNAHLQKLENLDIPVVCFDKIPATDDFNRVSVGDEEAAHLAAKELIGCQKKNILGVFGNNNLSITKRRLNSFEETLYKNNIQPTIIHASTSEEAHNLTKQLLNKKNKIDAIFCMSDEILIGVTKALQELEIVFPKNIGLIAISNGFIPTLFHPKITYVETSGFKLGKAAFNKMLSVKAGNSTKQEVILDTVLVQGGSL